MADREEYAATLGAIAEGILGRMTELSHRRDEILAECRQVVRHSANAIRAAHRNDREAHRKEIEAARALTGGLTALAQEFPAIYWAGYVQDALKEYAEALILDSLLQGSSIPSPSETGIEDAAWLNGLAEAGSELRRDVLDRLRSERAEDAEELVARMDEIYAVLVTIDFPDSVTGGLRRATDAFRAVLERTRGDLTLTLNQRRLEHALAVHQAAIQPGEG